MNSRYLTATLIALLFGIGIALPQTTQAHGKGGIPEVLAKLDQIQQQLDALERSVSGNATEIATVRTQVADVSANAIPCTPNRFRQGLCGADNHPLDLTVTLCGTLGADGSFSTAYALSGSVEAQVGAGWKDAPDVHLVEKVELPPGIPLILPIVPPIPVGWIMLPSEIAAALSAGAGIGIDACIDDIRLPVGKAIAEPVVLDLLDQLEQTATPVVQFLANQLSDSPQSVMTSTRSASFSGGNGLDGLMNALTVLPIGSRLNSILDDPSTLVVPALNDAAPGSGIAGAIAQIDAVFQNLCLVTSASSFAARTSVICSYIAAAVPSLDQLVQLIANATLIPDIPETIKSVLQPLFSNPGEIITNPNNPFCTSRVGSRPIFDSLCGRN